MSLRNYSDYSDNCTIGSMFNPLEIVIITVVSGLFVAVSIFGFFVICAMGYLQERNQDQRSCHVDRIQPREIESLLKNKRMMMKKPTKLWSCLEHLHQRTGMPINIRMLIYNTLKLLERKRHIEYLLVWNQRLQACLQTIPPRD